ncbi:heparinase II/III family protein [Maribellus luteus]|uniref:heparinase II/III family protein n=1 Tax=Maribellus luteus TaxID=2305463 RepID=UPI0011C43F1D|nr:heparinase II/III family protein [Maribellus luteus]
MRRKALKGDTRCYSQHQSLNTFLSVIDIQHSIEESVVDYHIKMYLRHRYDLLGSGWVKHTYCSQPLGVEGIKYNENIKIEDFDKAGNWLSKILAPAHLEESKRIWALTDEGYEPIDWQKDFKSGARYGNNIWYKDCRKVVNKKGVDVKVPWELSRMQHLAQLAAFSIFKNKEVRSKIIREFRNQFLDFSATNPPQMGVCWNCTMDVAVRASNLLIAYDILKQVDDENILDDAFGALFVQSMYEHGKHIVNNIEYAFIPSNHFLSNVVGLLYISAYLPGSEETDTWLAFSLQEVIARMKQQFSDDGTNFESSTAYHRISTEMMLYATALIVSLPENRKKALAKYDHKRWTKNPVLKARKFQEWNSESGKILPDWFVKRLYQAGRFVFDITKPTNEVPQIGDNDSGRFLKLSPVGKFVPNKEVEKKYANLNGYNELISNYAEEDEDFWDENALNHSSLLAAMSGLFDDSDFDRSNDLWLEKSLVQSLSNGEKFRISGTNSIVSSLSASTENLEYKSEWVYTASLNSRDKLTDKLQFIAYSDFGVYIFKSTRVYLSILGVTNSSNQPFAHFHDDKLSFELTIDGKDIVVDPGSYLYTPLPDIYKAFKSSKAHHSIIVESRKQGLIHNLSRKNRYPKIDIVGLDVNSICLQVKMKDIIKQRRFTIEENRVVIESSCNRAFLDNTGKVKEYSNGYGKLLNNVL